MISTMQASLHTGSDPRMQPPRLRRDTRTRHKIAGEQLTNDIAGGAVLVVLLWLAARDPDNPNGAPGPAAKARLQSAGAAAGAANRCAFVGARAVC